MESAQYPQRSKSLGLLATQQLRCRNGAPLGPKYYRRL